MQVFIIGATGRIGSRLTQRLSRGGHRPRALHRRAEQVQALEAAGAQAIQGDLTRLSAAALAETMAGSDAVVFAAGAGGASRAATDAIDGQGAARAVDAAGLAGISRFILVSAFPEAGRDRARSEDFEHYVRVKKDADAHLAQSGLDFVMVRPGRLTDESGSGRVRAALALPYGSIAREDVAAVLAALVECPAISRTIVEVTSGDTPIESALSRLAGGAA